jgi:hypothetical protein
VSNPAFISADSTYATAVGTEPVSSSRPRARRGYTFYYGGVSSSGLQGFDANSTASGVVEVTLAQSAAAVAAATAATGGLMMLGAGTGGGCTAF